MKFFIDTGDIDEIREAVAMGAIDGVTTNPSLLSKSGLPTKKAIAQICEIVDGPVSAEVLATDEKSILTEGRELAKIHPKVVVKVPLIPDGLKAVRAFAKEGIRTNVTLCFSPTQAIFAAKAGATYVSPFIGRLDDISEEGMSVIRHIVTIFGNYDYATKVLVASVRSPMHVVEAAELGADICTVPFKVLTQLIKHPLTDVGLSKFLEDAKKIPKA
jgi:transaldolase